MPSSHLYVFSDACPSDWLVDGQDNVWHTIVNIVHQSDPNLQPLEGRRGHEEILSQDNLYTTLISRIQSKLPSGSFQKWQEGRSKQAKERYRRMFCSAFTAAQREYKSIISAFSFQEKTLRASKGALLQSYNQHIGGTEGRGIGFEEFTDGKARRQMKHSFVNFQRLSRDSGSRKPDACAASNVLVRRRPIRLLLQRNHTEWPIWVRWSLLHRCL